MENLNIDNVPSYLLNILSNSFSQVNEKERNSLMDISKMMFIYLYNRYLLFRSSEDNRKEHELIVLSNVLKISEKMELNYSDKKIAIAVSLFHDTCFIKRIMEEEIRKLEEKGSIKEANLLREKKKDQRRDHMKGGAKNTKEALEYINKINPHGWTIFTDKEIERSEKIVLKHDLIKTDELYPKRINTLELCCHESDILWPLHPIGVSADIERYGKDINEKENWTNQVKENLKLFDDMRKKYDKKNVDDRFIEKTYFRTEEGHRIFSNWLKFWNL
ncbi:MAG: hypothetical protein OEZ20_01395 [candidate division WOR-3 bacterium]|nr:hypothetical protein [candidate division WOR-3 bacterium]MDH5683111.1 hypothetical protein [candidate division WOR-3 bacterium]